MTDLCTAAMSDADLERALGDIGFRMMLAATQELREKLMAQAKQVMQEQEKRGQR